MKIKEITSQIRRDFNAVFECEHCGAEETRSGYDVANFHANVIPKMKCPVCKKTAPDTFRPLTPKYGKNEVI